MSLHEYLQRDPGCTQLAEGAIHAVAPLLQDPDPQPTLDQLEAWAFQLAGRMPLPWNTHQALDVLNAFLFEDLGFRGDRKTYDDPANAVLPRVVHRRRGLPIALSILWIDVARRLGLDAVGVALPGHFITALRTDLGLLCFDPFNGGRAVGEEAAAELVTRATSGQATFHPDMLRPAPHRAILARLVRNLHLRFAKSERWDEALWTSTHLVLLSPREALPYKERALVHLQRGDDARALADLKIAVELGERLDADLEAFLLRMRQG